MRSLRPVLVVVAVAAGLSACAKTNLTNLWRSPSANRPLQSILVIALERDEELRRTWEDALSSEFMANGVMARPGYSLFPTALPDSQQVVTVTRRDGYDGVLVAHRLSSSYTEKFSNDYSKNAPGESDNYWRSWYHTHFMQASSADPFKEGDARFQIDLANVAGRGTLMWTGSTTPVDPRDDEKVSKEVCGELVTELIRRELVAKR